VHCRYSYFTTWRSVSSEIAGLLSARPFVPFQIVMADGCKFEVNHLDFIA